MLSLLYSWLFGAGIEEWSEVAGKEKKTDTLRLPPEGLDEIMARDFQDKASGRNDGDTKRTRRRVVYLSRVGGLG